MLDFDKEQLCYHCGACAQICARNAIEMKCEEDGFFYPEINTELCIGCKACEKVCPRLNVSQSEGKLEDRTAYAATAAYGVNADRKSASGGVFFALANMVLSEGGYVAGCVFDKEFRAKTVVTRDVELVEKMRGSKYVWSDTTRVFREIKELLKAGETVLFSGMPCQTAALLNFCGKQKKLITCTLFCHGNGSGKMLAKYIEELQGRKQKRIENVIFRNHQGKMEDRVKVEFEDGSSMIEEKLENLYLRAFLEGMCGSNTCLDGNCQYKGERIPGNLILGDFWGYQGKLPNGISAIICDSYGCEIVDKTIRKDYLVCEKTKASSILIKNPYLLKGMSENIKKRQFELDMDENGFFDAYRKTGSLKWYKKIAYKIGISKMLIPIRDYMMKKRVIKG